MRILIHIYIYMYIYTYIYTYIYIIQLHGPTKVQQRSVAPVPERCGQFAPGKKQLSILHHLIIGFLRGGGSSKGGNWGTLKNPGEDWAILGKNRGINNPP